MNASLSLNIYQKTIEHHKFEYDFDVSNAEKRTQQDSGFHHV